MNFSYEGIAFNDLFLDSLSNFLETFNKPLMLPFYYHLRKHFQDHESPSIEFRAPLMSLFQTSDNPKIKERPSTKPLRPLGITMSESKCQQISDLVLTFKDYLEPEIMSGKIKRIQEICSGKANLGLTLAEHYQLAFYGYDYNPELITTLQARIDRYPTMISSEPNASKGSIPPSGARVLDILKEPVPFSQSDLSVALHACGRLSDKIIQDWVAAGGPGFLLVVPCCYSRFRDDSSEDQHTPSGDCSNSFGWLSKKYQRSQLPQRLNLELVQNLTTQIKGTKSGPRQERLRKEIAFKRLLKVALNLFLHDHPEYADHPHFKGYRDQSGYTPIPDYLFRGIEIVDDPVKGLEALITKLDSFEQVCSTNSKSKIQTECSTPQLTSICETAIGLKAAIMASEAIIEPWKRLIELAIIDDRAEYLKEKGFQVVVKAFTSVEVTPRNHAILSWGGGRNAVPHNPLTWGT